MAAKKGNIDGKAPPDVHDKLNATEETPLIINSERNRKVNKKQIVLCVFILVTELCERLTFYGVAANLVPYCGDVLKLPTPVPSQVALAFSGKMFSISLFDMWLS